MPLIKIYFLNTIFIALSIIKATARKHYTLNYNQTRDILIKNYGQFEPRLIENRILKYGIENEIQDIFLMLVNDILDVEAYSKRLKLPEDLSLLSFEKILSENQEIDRFIAYSLNLEPQDSVFNYIIHNPTIYNFKYYIYRYALMECCNRLNIGFKDIYKSILESIDKNIIEYFEYLNNILDKKEYKCLDFLHIKIIERDTILCDKKCDLSIVKAIMNQYQINSIHLRNEFFDKKAIEKFEDLLNTINPDEIVFENCASENFYFLNINLRVDSIKKFVIKGIGKNGANFIRTILNKY